MEMNLKIDPEFQNKLPPLTDDEFKQLEENILQDGCVRVPIVVWNGTIVDGHHRYRIIQKHADLNLPWTIVEKRFTNKWAAFDWMYNNQFGTRNLTDEQRTVLLGKQYEARKKSVGGQVGNLNQSAKIRSAQNEHFVEQAAHAKQNKTAVQLANEHGVGVETVKRAEHYAHGIDAIQEHEPELAESILKSKRKVKKADIMAVGTAKPEEQPDMIQAIKNGERVCKPLINGPRGSTGGTRENRALKKEINTIIESMSDNTPMDYTIDNLTEQISCNADSFVGMISNLIMDHRDVCNENMDKVVEAISRIIEKIEKIKERLSDGAQL